MSLVRKQSAFARCVARLILHAQDELGLDTTFGETWRHPNRPGGHPRSTHRSRLAVDLLLHRGGVYLTKTEDYRVLGEFWESLDPRCRWGGRFADGNHFSFEHEGVS